MFCPIEIYRIDASTLYVRIENQASLIIISQTNNVTDKFFRFDARKWSIKIGGITDVDRIDAGHTRVDNKCVKFLTVSSIGTHLPMTTGTNRACSIE